MFFIEKIKVIVFSDLKRKSEIEHFPSYEKTKRRIISCKKSKNKNSAFLLRNKSKFDLTMMNEELV